MADFAPLRVAEVEPLTDEAVALRFDVPPELAADYRFSPGQHVTLRRVLDGVDLRRTYSVCASSAGGPLRVAVKRVPGGALSTWLTTQVRPGDVVEVLPPAGRFGPALDPEHRRTYGLVAAGSGITPVLSIARSVLDVEPHSAVVLVYGNRTTRDAMFVDELADLKDRDPERLQLVHVLSREAQASDLLTGRLDRDRTARILDVLVPVDEVDLWFVCGPLGMVEDVRAALLDAGVAPDRVRVELFHAGSPPPPPPAGDRAPTTLVAALHGRTTTVDTDRDALLLDAVLRARADAPYACRGGVCGTCRARVLEGEVQRGTEWALEPDERDAGLVLTCQARALSDRVVLDFV